MTISQNHSFIPLKIIQRLVNEEFFLWVKDMEMKTNWIQELEIEFSWDSYYKEMLKPLTLK
jgi:hypothetical protein